jgi:serine protease Do
MIDGRGRRNEMKQNCQGVRGGPGSERRPGARALTALAGVVAALGLSAAPAAPGSPAAPEVEEEYLPAAAPAAEELQGEIEEQVQEALDEAGPAFKMLARWGDGAWIGVKIEDVGEEADAAGAYGARVAGVEEDSPAKRAGLQEDDLIVSFQGERVESARALQRMVSETPAGRTVRLGIRRAGAEREVQVKLEERPAGAHAWRGPGHHGFRFEAPLPPDAPDADAWMRHSWPGAARPRLGVQVQALTPQLARFFGVKEGGGVLVEEVRAGSAAERAGLQAGDVIVKVDGSEVGDPAELSEALTAAEGGRATLTIVRDRAERTLQATLDKPKEKPRARAPRPPKPAPPPSPQDDPGDPI